MDWNRLFALRAAAQAENLRNRDLTARCKCGNILTISDRIICRECRRSR